MSYMHKYKQPGSAPTQESPYDRKALIMKFLWLLPLFFVFPIQAQDLPCSPIAFFAPTCSTVAAVPPPSPLPLPPPPYVNRDTQDQPRPLFTPETVAPDTPPLLLELLNAPTLDHDLARQFLDWQAARTARILDVQQLLQSLTRSRDKKEP